jgi:monovalent cation:H+ antiporter-2, CPA2 family
VQRGAICEAGNPARWRPAKSPMDHSSSFVTDLSVVLGVAAVAALVFRWLRQPALLGYLVAGLLIGPYIPIPVFADPGRVQALSEFGVILVMFSVGLEFSFRRLVRVLPRSGITGLVQMSVMLWAGFGVGRLLDWTVVESIFFGAALAISSTMVVAKVFDEEKPDRRLRELVFGVLVVQDVVAVALIAALTAIASGSSVSGEEIAKVVGLLAAVLVAMVVVGMPVVPRLMRSIVKGGSSEVIVVGTCGICFGMAVLAENLGYSVALGAFLAGMLVAESGRAIRVETLILPIRDLFAAVFFVSIGMLVDPRVAWENIHVALGVSMLVIVGQLLSVTTAGVFSGNGLRRSVRAGLSLGQIGEFSFIMVGIGVVANVIRPNILPIVVAVAAITAFTTPTLVRGSDKLASTIDHLLPRRLQTVLSLYESWFESMAQRPASRSRRARTRKLIALLVADATVVTAVVIATSIWRTRFVGTVERIGVSPELSGPVVLMTALAIMIPFVLGMLRVSRALAKLFAEAVLPAAPDRAPDLADAPRRVLAVALQMVAIVAAGAPVVVVTGPFLPPLYGVFVLGAVVVVLSLYLWRNAQNLQGHVRAGAEVVLELLARQGSAEETGVAGVEELLPGLGPISAVPILAGSAAAGQTLAQLDLRAKTGATVVAIRRGQAPVVTPSGHEKLLLGDVLALTGTTDSVAQARALIGPPVDGAAQLPNAPVEPDES